MAGGGSEKTFWGFQGCLCCRWEQEGSSWIIYKPSLGAVGFGERSLSVGDHLKECFGWCGTWGKVGGGEEAPEKQDRGKSGQEVFLSSSSGSPCPAPKATRADGCSHGNLWLGLDQLQLKNHGMVGGGRTLKSI